MPDRKFSLLLQTFPAIQKKEPVAPYTTFGLGGRSAYLLETLYPAEVVKAVSLARRLRLPCRLIAGGSNVVVADRFFSGLTIIFRAGDSWGDRFDPAVIDRLLLVNKNHLTCTASVPLPALVERSLVLGLAGLETLVGIPGTVGGAVIGNAGAYGREIAEVVRRVEIFDGRKVRWLTRAACHFTYRHSIFKNKKWIVLRVEFVCLVGDKKTLRQKAKVILKERTKKFARLRCPGSFFKNIILADVSKKVLTGIDPAKIKGGKIPAGYLLEMVGAKGMKIGEVRIAPTHGNMMINSGRATYRDVSRLAHRLKALVRRRFGITLEEEIKYIS